MTIFVLTKKRGHFWTLFWSKIWPFLLKNQVFGHFLRIRTSNLSKTWSETWGNCFESLNGSVVSRKILVIIIIRALRLAAIVFMCFFNLAAAERPQHCVIVWYGSCSYGPLWENHTLYGGKILVWWNFSPFKAKIWPF